jgi:hypothetical protein
VKSVAGLVGANDIGLLWLRLAKARDRQRDQGDQQERIEDEACLRQRPIPPRI